MPMLRRMLLVSIQLMATEEWGLVVLRRGNIFKQKLDKVIPGVSRDQVQRYALMIWLMFAVNS
jgi:hypothetical protein